MLSCDNPFNCNTFPAVSLKMTVAVSVCRLLKLLALITGPSFKVSFNGVPLTVRMALKLNLPIVSPTPVKE